MIAYDPELHEKFLAAVRTSLDAYTALVTGLEEKFADPPSTTLRAQTGPAGGAVGAVERHRDPHRVECVRSADDIVA